jgi:DnaK suppressor protein
VESRELANIENALHRMSAGKYGSCEVCNGTIPLARLNALPYATMCIECQRDLERSGSSGMSRYDDREEQTEETVTGDLEF